MRKLIEFFPVVFGEDVRCQRDRNGALNYGLLLAGAVIAMIPCIVVYVSLQRYYVRGLVSGALKG